MLTLNQIGREAIIHHHIHTPYHKPESCWYVRRYHNVFVEIADEGYDRQEPHFGTPVIIGL